MRDRLMIPTTVHVATVKLLMLVCAASAGTVNQLMETNMKIIKKQDVSGWAFKHTCTNCESELQVEPSDLRHSSYPGDMRESGYETFTANCVVCSQSFTIANDKIPKLIQIEVKKRSSSTGGYYDR